MGLIAKETGGSRIPPIEAGSYPAVCYALVDLGDQYSQKFDKCSRQVLIMWEIPGETITIEGEELPRALSATYTNSLSKKAKLRTMLEGWRGRAFTAEELKGFDLSKLIGIGCMIGVTHTRKTDGSEYAKISSVSKLPKGFTVPEPQNTSVVFDLDKPGALDKMAILPEWVQNRVRESETYKNMICAPDGSAPAKQNDFFAIDDSEDLPF